MSGLRILIGCETSGVMRRAFAARGHDAWSCDLLPAEDGSNRHIRGDVRDYLGDGWDLLMVCHPPCTRLCNSGVRWLHTPPPGRTREAMWAELEEGVALFAACWQAPVGRVAVENPIMHRHAREWMPSDLPRPQIVQPWWFGERAFKATGFYLRGLPPLSLAPIPAADRMRAAPRDGLVSTIEAVAAALALVEGPAVAEPLLQLFAFAVDRARQAGRRSAPATG